MLAALVSIAVLATGAEGAPTVCSALPRDASGRTTATQRTCLLCEPIAAAGPLLPNVDYIVSGGCDGVESGALLLPGSVTVPRGTSLTVQAGVSVAITGDIVVDGEGVTLTNLKVHGSVNVTDGRGLAINGLRLVARPGATTPAVRGYRAALDGATIAGVQVVGSPVQPRAPVALLGCSGLVSITCDAATDRVLVQQAGSLTLSLYGCAGPLDLDALIASFGRAYEAEYLNDFMTAKPGATPVLRQVVFYTAYLTAALGVYTVASGPAKVKLS